MGSETPQRLATLVGCNYFHTRNELRGCINDVKAMRRILVDRFGFDPKHVTVLTDEAGAKVLPTGQNIKAALAAMIGKAKPGDVLFFHYSGHGTTVPATKPHHRRGEKDEAIVPCDFNLITDVDFRELVNKLPNGTSLTMVSDSCHSGGLIDQEKEQIGPMATPESTVEGGSSKDKAQSKARYIPIDHILAHLASLSGLDSPHVGVHLSALHGAHASAKFVAADDDDSTLEKKPLHPDNGILLSGCQADETSADMCDDDQDTSKAYGAFSNAIQMVLADEHASLTNRLLVTKVRHLLGRQGFDQHPCLYCSDGNAEKSFLEEEKLQKHQQSGKHKRKAHKQLQELLHSDEA